VDNQTVGGTVGGSTTAARLKLIPSTTKSAGTAERNRGPAILIIPASTGRATLGQWSSTGKLSVDETGGADSRIL